MKKTSKTLLSILFISSLFSCGNGILASGPEVVTGIEIAGPVSVEVGKTIPLICDVVGSEKDEVTWSSSNTSIASVNEDGVVTGINEGTVTISATSTLDSSFVATYEISVTLPKMQEIKILVEESDEVVKNPETGVYDVPLGKVFTIDFETSPANAREPDSVSYEVIFPADAGETNAFTVEVQPDKSAIVYPYGEIRGVAIKVSANYDDLASGALISSAYFNVYDKNVENKQTVLNRINDFKAIETESLISSKVSKNLEVTYGGETSTTKENITHNSFTNASYTNKQVNENGTVTNTKLYHGVYNNSYYTYEYDDNQNITQLYENCAANANNTSLSSLYCNFVAGSLTYGHSGILNSFFELQNTLTESVITFGSSMCYAYSEYSLSDNQYIITSNFVDYITDYTYDVKLVINFDDSSRVTGYTFEETVISSVSEYAESSDVQITKYKEVASDFVYGTKTDDASYNSRVDMRGYYYSSFDIVDISGTRKETVINGETVTVYDYTSNKYGPKLVQTDSATGLKKYSTTYDKTLVFGIDNFEPATATTKIDTIRSTSSDPSQVPNITITTSGIITINANKDDDGLSLPGCSTFTFTSKNGYSQSIIVEFFAVELTDILVTNIDASNDLGVIFQNELSNYFFLNTEPDEARYTFGIEILEGPSNGISLYQHEKNNLDGLPSFSFSILGNRIGTYKFKFFVTQNPTINTSAIYTITVADPLYPVDLTQKLVNSHAAYGYDTGTTEFKVTFTNETTLTFEQTSSYGLAISNEIKYHFEKGAICIDANQTLTTEGSYFYRIKEGKAPFKYDFATGKITSISLYLQTTAENEDDPINIRYTPYTFKEMIDLSKLDSYLNGKTLTGYLFISGQGNLKVDLTFSSNHATVVITTEEGATYATINFDFTYDSTYYSFYASNFTSTKSQFKNVSSFDYLKAYAKLRLTFTYSGSKMSVDFTI